MPILGFTGKYNFLSNFYPSRIEFEDHKYNTVEHAYQAAKSISGEKRRSIRLASTPAEAKALGRKVKLREDWEQIKEQVMLDLLRKKFSILSLKEKLLNTGDEYLEETNHWKDTYWGVCNNKGKNRLGHLLMKVRSELQKKGKK